MLFSVEEFNKLYATDTFFLRRVSLQKVALCYTVTKSTISTDIYIVYSNDTTVLGYYIGGILICSNHLHNIFTLGNGEFVFMPYRDCGDIVCVTTAGEVFYGAWHELFPYLCHRKVKIPYKSFWYILEYLDVNICSRGTHKASGNVYSCAYDPMGYGCVYCVDGGVVSYGVPVELVYRRANSLVVDLPDCTSLVFTDLFSSYTMNPVFKLQPPSIPGIPRISNMCFVVDATDNTLLGLLVFYNDILSADSLVYLFFIDTLDRVLPLYSLHGCRLHMDAGEFQLLSTDGVMINVADDIRKFLETTGTSAEIRLI